LTTGKDQNMTSFSEKITGIYHFLTDRTPGDTSLVNPRPRPVNPWHREGKPVVARVTAGDDLRESVRNAFSLLGEPQQFITKGETVFVKPNFNSPDPYPASTDMEFLRTVVEWLLEAGARVTIGDSSGGVWRPTRNVLSKLGVYDLAKKLGVELIAFEDNPRDWVRVKIGGDYLKLATMPRSTYQADKIVYLPCAKTHSLSQFSGTLKLVVGFMHPGERRALHLRHLQQKVAELNLCWQPDLVIMDGRKVFVAGGPEKGQLTEPGVLLASGDAVATDIEAVKMLLEYGAEKSLPADPRQLPQIAAALKHGLGAPDGDYLLVE